MHDLGLQRIFREREILGLTVWWVKESSEECGKLGVYLERESRMAMVNGGDLDGGGWEKQKVRVF